MAAPKVDIIVNLLTALRPFAGGVTTLPLNDADQPLDYSRLIGGIVVDHDNKISQLTSSLNTLYGYVTTLQTQMATIIANGLTVPKIQLSVIMGDAAYYNVEVVVAAIGSQFDTLRTATGTSAELSEAVAYQDKIYADSVETLESQDSFTSPLSTMSELNGWVVDKTTIADSIKNMWITINDMRKAIEVTLAPRITTSCTSVIINFSTYRDVVNKTITLFFLGNSTIPEGFIDTNGNGASLLITDGSSTPNTYTTYVNVSQANKSVNGVTIDLTGTSINLYTTLRLDLTYSLTDGNLVCSGTRTYTGLTTTATPCVPLLLTPLSSTAFTGVFNPVMNVQGISYSISTYSNEACTTIVTGSTRTYSNITQSQISYSINSGLTGGSGYTYYVKMTITTGTPTTTTTCQIQSITLP